MAGITDKAFRQIAKEHGCGLVYTEMISAKALTYNNQKTKVILDIEGEVQPVAVQLFGSEPEVMAEGARIALEAGAPLIDVNMGCPVPKVVKCGEGSALLNNPTRAEEIVRTMVKAVDVPVTVKIRLGWDKDNITAVEFALRMEEAGVSAIAVHGRTRDMFYSGKADWATIGKVKAALRIPVIANGDVWTPRDAVRLLEETGCDAVMIGRGALGNPWLISQVLSYLERREVIQPTPRERILGALKHLDLMIHYKGEGVGVREMRTHLAWYLKGLPCTAPLKEAIFRAKTRTETVGLLEGYLDRMYPC
jgi:tRNA-dihydrouridine synthase B